MDENSNSGKSSISKSSTLEGIADFWDSHSLADHWDQTHEAEYEVRAQRRHRITLDPEIYQRLEEQARTRGVTPETLVHQWLSERLAGEKADAGHLTHFIHQRPFAASVYINSSGY
jgi:hypothetical protein